MKKTSLLLVACACVLAAAGCSAQRTADGKPVPERVMGVFGLYPENIAPIADAPEGCEPCYISHYGRHGSRYLLDQGQYTYVRDLLSRAAEEGRLTENGEKAYRDFMQVYPRFEGRAGQLTPVGADQQRAIARRMARRHPSLFGRDAKVRASATPTSRTQESMDAFCKQLRACCPALRIVCTTDAALNPYAAASGIPTEYDLRVKSPEAEWRPGFDAFCRRKIDARRIAGRIFTDADDAAARCDLTDFVRGIFRIAVHFRGCGTKTDWLRLFTRDELCALAECEAYTFYMEKGPARETSDRTWALSVHILHKMLQDAERDIPDGVGANLRFGHDGCIMALLTLMGAEGWTRIAATQQEAARAWDVSRIPMACNLQWIFYRPRSGGGAMRVRLLLNETPLRLPITDLNGTYAWNDLKTYLEGRCRAAFAMLEQQHSPVDANNR